MNKFWNKLLLRKMMKNGENLKLMINKFNLYKLFNNKIRIIITILLQLLIKINYLKDSKVVIVVDFK